MSDVFVVYDLETRSSKTMDFDSICSLYPDVDLSLLKEDCISVITIYNKGKRVAVINRRRMV